ncbi:MAG: M48 family metallopeptidase [Bacilli bacterium]|nr:M48 family metallopeptidase [Bacilli bacterium]
MFDNFIFIKDGKEYPVIVKRKKMRSVRYSFKEGEFHVSAPRMASKIFIKSGLEKFFDKLVKDNPTISGQGEDYIYILGEKYPLTEEHIIHLNNGDIISYKDNEDLEKKLKKWFLIYITTRVRKYEEIMNTYESKVRVRRMTTRYGSNVPAHKSITFCMVLIHYQEDIIDSVVIHELAHNFELNHQANFYKIVYQYCPNYKQLRQYLIKGVFAHD